MAGYRYEAMNGEGGVISGVIQADTIRHARTLLRDKGLTPLDVAEVTSEAPAIRGLSLRRGVSTAQLSLMTRQFASLMSAEVSLSKALGALIKQTESPRMAQVLAGVRGKVLEGASLAVAMRDYPKVFPDLYRSLVAAGEKSGKLDDTLLKLADYVERTHELKRKTGLALIYPVIMTVVALMVVSGLLVYVIPKVAKVFAHTHQALPWLTRFFIFLSDGIRSYGIYGAVALVAAGFGIRVLLRDEARRHVWHAWLLKTPLVGDLVRTANSARLASTLSIQLGSGVPLSSALDSTSGVITNLPMRKALNEAGEMVMEGGTLSKALEKSGLFPPILVYFVANGEETDRLGVMLEKAARQQSTELSHRLTALTSVLEPVMTLAMGVMVLIIVLAVLLPIFEMSQLAR